MTHKSHSYSELIKLDGWVAIAIIIVGIILSITQLDKKSNNAVEVGTWAVEAAIREAKNKGETILVDSRLPDSFKVGHIPTAINVTPSSAETASIENKVKYIIVYCDENKKDEETVACTLQGRYPYKRVAVYPYGIKGWKEAGGSIEVLKEDNKTKAKKNEK